MNLNSHSLRGSCERFAQTGLSPLTNVNISLAFTVLGVLLLTMAAASAGDWRQFRGNLANSIAEGEQLPHELSGESIAWKVELPGRGLCGPVVIGDRVFVTASSGYSQDRLSVLAFST
ncbi:MAG: hypothetical protein KDA96_20180, partial [Planctomycetaceae bacterium]|nr:hypothetical protein [Planctomycetaceae bacterium]